MRRAHDTPEGVRCLWTATRLTRALGYGVYVFRAGDWLVDCGFRRGRRDLFDDEILHGVAGCVLTHYHEDHAGNAAGLLRAGVHVRAPSEVARRVALRHRLHAYQRAMWGTPEPAAVSAGERPVEGGGWRLVPLPTPGHSPDHHVLHEPDRGVVFAGDLYLGRRVSAARREEDLGDLLRSLRRVRDLEPAALFCAHRGRIGDPGPALSEKIGWIEDLIAGAARLRERGLGVARIARELLGSEGVTWIVTAGDLSRRNLIELALTAGADTRPVDAR